MTDGHLGMLTLPLIRARIDEAKEKDYTGGVLGVHARPVWDGPEHFDHQGAPVIVVPCVSALAIRDAMVQWSKSGWLVVVTDRSPDDLGDGILGHLIGSRLRTPDEWEALRQRFHANGIDPDLRNNNSREVAAGLLGAEPSDGWPPAPSGVLTRDHAFVAVFRHHLGLDDAGGPFDSTSVLRWTCDPQAAARLADLRQIAGDQLVDATLSWAADRLGRAGEPILTLLRSGHLADVVPLGIVVGLLINRELNTAEAAIAQSAKIRLEPRLGGSIPTSTALHAWWDEASTVPTTPALQARADDLLVALLAAPLASRSDLLPSGLHARLTTLADRLRTACATGLSRSERDPGSAAIVDDDAAAIEHAWSAVRRHRLAQSDGRVKPFAAAVRLTRWLARGDEQAPSSMTDLVARHLDHDAWVDLAINDAASGAGDNEHGSALFAVLELARQRRDAHDIAFAEQLSILTREDPASPGVRYLENVMADDVGPLLTKKAPVLLLVLDGMSVSTAIEVIGDAEKQGWREYARTARRSSALAVLPSLTELSRASLFCGKLTSGGQAQEVTGVAEFGRARGLGAKLFHKKLLDSSRPGFAVSDEVGTAVDDIENTPLVACVLNTVDDALDRSDPGGTDWTLDAIKHLRPLLERARTAERVVVLTADHGHIVERRLGTQRNYPDVSSNRSRSAIPPAGAGEVLVEGRRVLQFGGRAVLAVDERLRYGPLKAGYHGGASPAEVIVPVCYLASGTSADLLSKILRPIPGQAPSWWDEPNAPIPAAPAQPSVPFIKASRPKASPPTDQEALPGLEFSRVPVPDPANHLVDAVLASPMYATQSALAGRAALDTDQVQSALSMLLATPGHRQTITALSAAVGASQRSRGAFAMLQRMLNVEGYQVLGVDPDGVTAVLDEDLLREQFGVSR